MLKQNEYREVFSKVRASEDTYRRIMNMTSKKARKSGRIAAKLVVLAAVLSVLGLTAAASQLNWFALFFGGSENLNQEQVQYLEENTQVQSEAAAQNTESGYDVTVDSLLTDGETAYFHLNVTLPQDIPSPGDGWEMGDLHFYDVWLYPASQEKAEEADIMNWVSGVKAVDDGDGLDHTQMLVLSMRRSDIQSVFAEAAQWKLYIGGIEVIWRNAENEKTLYEGEYAGQDVMLKEEEINQVMRFEILCEDSWEYVLSFGGTGAEQAVEMVTEPISLFGYRHATMSELQEKPEKDQYGPYEIQLISLRISPLSYYIAYVGEMNVDPGEFTLVMKDGREIPLFQYAGRHNFQEPVILEEIGYVLLSDGTRLTVTE